MFYECRVPAMQGLLDHRDWQPTRPGSPGAIHRRLPGHRESGVCCQSGRSEEGEMIIWSGAQTYLTLSTLQSFLDL